MELVGSHFDVTRQTSGALPGHPRSQDPSEQGSCAGVLKPDVEVKGYPWENPSELPCTDCRGSFSSAATLNRNVWTSRSKKRRNYVVLGGWATLENLPSELQVLLPPSLGAQLLQSATCCS